MVDALPIRESSGRDRSGPALATARPSLRETIASRDRLTEETGHYWGLERLSLKETDPLTYERFHSRLQSATMAAREKARFVAASPGGREMGEAVWALATAEGDSISMSEGFVAHSAAFPVAVRFMVERGYEENPGFRDGDVYVASDGYSCGAPHPGDVYTYVPIVRDGEVVAWACAINHIMEAGAPQAGSWAMFSVDTYTDGFVCPPIKSGENLKQYSWWDEMWKRRTRAGMMNLLDDKMRLAGAAMILKSTHEIIDEFGLDYFKQASREGIEESRRVVIGNIRACLVPGTYEQAGFRVCRYKDLQKIWERADKDSLLHMHMTSCVDEKGRLAVDMEGSSPWGFHAFNAYRGGAEVALNLGLSDVLAYNTKFTAGVNYAINGHFPTGSIYNPGTQVAAHSNAWAQMLQITTMTINSITRGEFMRGYLEECFVGCATWDSVQGEGVLEDGTPYGFTNFELLGACGHGGFAYRDGESAVWFIASQLCNMGNSEEFEYLIPPFFHLGRKLQPGLCGHGKYRGGIGLTTVHWVVRPGQHVSASRAGSACAFMPEVAQGMMGGYPSPGAAVAVAQGTNLSELIRDGVTPTTFQELVDLVASGRLSAERFGVWKSDAPEHVLGQDDVWAQMGGTGGGWGDPLERDPQAVLDDANAGRVPAGFSEGLYGVVLAREGDRYRLDESSTRGRRAELRSERRSRSVPVRQWYEETRERVLAEDFAEPIREMYRGSMSFEGYDRHYRSFWHLPQAPDRTPEGGETP